MLKRLQTGFVSARPLENVFSSHLYNGADHELSVNGLITPVDFRHTVPADEIHYLYQFVVHILDGTINLDKFGGLGVLANGIAVSFFDSSDTELFDPMDGHNITRLADFSILAGVFLEKTSGNVDDVFSVSWSVHSSFGGPLRMDPGDYFQFKVQDDLSTLTQFHCFVSGSKMPNDG